MIPTWFESSVISYGSQTLRKSVDNRIGLRVVLSHMVVKHVRRLFLCDGCLRVVLSHMVVKQTYATPSFG